MKFLLSLVFTLGLLFSFSSCKRCYQCIVVNSEDELQWGYNKVCERADALEDYEKICNDAVQDRIKELGPDSDETDISCKCGENLDI